MKRKEIFHWIETIGRNLVLGILVVIVVWVLRMNDDLFSPMNPDVLLKPDPAAIALGLMGAERWRIPKLAEAVNLASAATNLYPELLIVVIWEESEFNPHAVGPPVPRLGNFRFKGLMQCDRASFKYPDVDVLNGARELETKLKEAKGDLPYALALFKGGNNPAAWRLARKTYYRFHVLRAGVRDRIERMQATM